MTTADVYTTRSDLYDYGLPRGLLSNTGRLCASVLASTDTFELDGHGFGLDQPLIVRIDAGGTMPVPLVANGTVYAIPVNDWTFQVASAPSGPAIDLTTNGELVVVATPLPFDKVMEYYSRWADGCLGGNAVPLKSPYPPIVVGIVAKLSAKALLILANQSSASMDDAEIDAKAQLERFAKGAPIRDARATGPANLAYGESVQDTRGWGACGERIP